MKPKSTLQWTESFLKKYLADTESIGFGEMEQVNYLLKLHSTLLPNTAEQRLEHLEREIKAMRSDGELGKIRMGR